MVFKDGSWELYRDEGRYVNGGPLCCFALQGGNVRAVYEYGTLCIVHSHWAVSYEVVDEKVFKKFLRRASNFPIEGSRFVRSFDFAMVEQFLVLSNGGHKRVVGNDGTRFSGLWNGCVVIVEASVIFDELHDGSIGAVYAKGCLDGSIHCNTALLSDGGHGEDVCK